MWSLLAGDRTADSQRRGKWSINEVRIPEDVK